MDDLSWVELNEFFFFSFFLFSFPSIASEKRSTSRELSPNLWKSVKIPNWSIHHFASHQSNKKKRNISPNTKLFKSKKNSTKYHSRTRMSKPFPYLQDKQTLLKPCKVILNLKSNFETKLCNCIQCILFFLSYFIFHINK